MKPSIKQRLAVAVRDSISFSIMGGCALTISTTAYAASTTTDNSVQLSPVEVQAQTPDTSNIISREEMDRFGIISAADLLKGIAGVQVGDSRNGGGLDVNIRGIQGQERVIITVDGAQQSLATYRGYGGTQQRSYIDPDLISQIAVIKGVNSASTPVGGVGGTVVMKTLTADDIVLANKTSGFRITGDFLDNSITPEYRSTVVDLKADLSTTPHSSRGNFFSNSAKAGTLAYANKSEYVDLVAAYAKRKQGNYFTGKHGHERYRIFDSNDKEKNSTAKSYAAGEEVLNTSAETESLLLKTVLRPQDDHEFELIYRYFSGQYGEIMPSDIFRSSSAGILQYPVGDVQINTVSARYHFDPTQNDLINLHATLWWNNAKTEQLNSSFFAPKSQVYVTDRAWTRVDNERIGGDIDNTSVFDSGYGLFKLHLGASFQHEDLSPLKSVYISEHDRNVNKFVRDGYRDEVNLNMQLDYEPTERWKLWAGAKYSSFKATDRNQERYAIREPKKFQEITILDNGTWVGSMYWFPDENGQYTDATDPRLNNGIVFGDTNNPFAGSHYNDISSPGSIVYPEHEINIVTGFAAKPALKSKDSALTPSVGISYKVLENTLLFGSYTIGSRMPSLFDTTLGTHQVSPVAGLKPERAKVLEIGASTEFSALFSAEDRANIRLSYFDSYIKNFITRYYDDFKFGAMFMTNADSYAVDGLEFSTNYYHPRFFLDLAATYYFSTETCDAAFADNLRRTAHRYKPTEDTPDCTPGGYVGSYINTQNPPKFSADLTLGQHFYNKKLTVGGRTSYMSGPTEKLDKPWQTGDTTPQIEYKPVTLLDVFLTYRPNDNVILNTAVQNLTNRYYLDALSQSFMPSPGRTFKAGVTVKF